MKHVLLIEDNDIDARLFEQALKLAQPDVTLTRLPDVAQADSYLQGAGAYADRGAHPLPYLAVIDLNLETTSGMELLKSIQTKPELKPLITLMFSGTRNYRDAHSAYKTGASSFLRKPDGRDALAGSLTHLHELWRIRKLLPVDGE
jgi:CheY-like chemotaxis protein